MVSDSKKRTKTSSTSSPVKAAAAAPPIALSKEEVYNVRIHFA